MPPNSKSRKCPTKVENPVKSGGTGQCHLGVPFQRCLIANSGMLLKLATCAMLSRTLPNAFFI